MTAADTIRSALGALVARSGVTPGDGPLTSRQKVLRFLAAEGATGEPHDPEGCPVARWLRRATGLRVLLTPTRAVVTGGRTRSKRGRWRVERAVVDLPPPVAHAVAEVDGYRATWLTGPQAQAGPEDSEHRDAA